MKIQSKYITANTQIYNGKCNFVGIACETGKSVAIHNIEESGTAAAGNRIGYENGLGHMLPLPGVECSNGLYVVIDGNASVYYYL